MLLWCKLYKSVRESQEMRYPYNLERWCKLYKSVRESQVVLALRQD